MALWNQMNEREQRDAIVAALIANGRYEDAQDVENPTRSRFRNTVYDEALPSDPDSAQPGYNVDAASQGYAAMTGMPGVGLQGTTAQTGGSVLGYGSPVSGYGLQGAFNDSASQAAQAQAPATIGDRGGAFGPGFSAMGWSAPAVSTMGMLNEGAPAEVAGIPAGWGPGHLGAPAAPDTGYGSPAAFAAVDAQAANVNAAYAAQLADALASLDAPGSPAPSSPAPGNPGFAAPDANNAISNALSDAINASIANDIAGQIAAGPFGGDVSGGYTGGGFGGATGDGTSGGFGAEAGGPGVGGASTGISGGPGGSGEGGANTGEGGGGGGGDGGGSK
jgi:hypothetical protein